MARAQCCAGRHRAHGGDDQLDGRVVDASPLLVTLVAGALRPRRAGRARRGPRHVRRRAVAGSLAVARHPDARAGRLRDGARLFAARPHRPPGGTGRRAGPRVLRDLADGLPRHRTRDGHHRRARRRVGPWDR